MNFIWTWSVQQIRSRLVVGKSYCTLRVTVVYFNPRPTEPRFIPFLKTCRLDQLASNEAI